MITQSKSLLFSPLLVLMFWTCTGEPKKQESSPEATRVDQVVEKVEVKTDEMAPAAESLTNEAAADARGEEESNGEEKVKEKEHTAETNALTEEAIAQQKRREKRRKEREEKRKKERKRKKEKARGKPVISFENSVYDYGTIQQGKKVNHQFKFKNTGKSELVISNVSVSCGCTHPSYPFIPIAPGEEGFIGVSFDSAGRLGKQKPTITVMTNANPKSYELRLEGFVDASRQTPIESQDSL
ncbi:MAG: DUF1573 domain-containing protein [Bacteroidota bacterium]